MTDSDEEKPSLPPTEIDMRGGARVRKGNITSRWSRTGKEIEDDFKEETGHSLDTPSFLRKPRKDEKQEE